MVGRLSRQVKDGCFLGELRAVSTNESVFVCAHMCILSALLYVCVCVLPSVSLCVCGCVCVCSKCSSVCGEGVEVALFVLLKIQ